MHDINITFTVTINYTHEDVNGVICPDSMRDNLFHAIENERVNGAITPTQISANSVDVSIQEPTT